MTRHSCFLNYFYYFLSLLVLAIQILFYFSEANENTLGRHEF